MNRALPYAFLFIPFVVAVAGCSTDSTFGNAYFPAMGSLSSAAGKGSFRFGASMAATQVEDQDPNTDFAIWSAPKEQGGLAKGTPVGDAVMGYTKAKDDVALVKALHLDSYRISLEWARIEPHRDQIDEAAIAHYREVLQALHDAGIRPLVTVHHYSNPVWIADPRDRDCKSGPSSDNLCGLGHPLGGAMVVTEMEQHAKLLAERFGDLVDEWETVSDPMGYLVGAYGVGSMPPGRTDLLNDILGRFVPVLRDYLEAHARMYAAIKANDTVDADGDGRAADVGLSLSIATWAAAQHNVPSMASDDLAALEAATNFYFYWAIDSLRTGTFDVNFDGNADETHAIWKDSIDWLGLQYYARIGVTRMAGVVPVLNFTPCIGGLDFGACLPAANATWWVKSMSYEFYAPGLGVLLKTFAKRYPKLPLVVTESGLATTVGTRRAEAVVRILEQIHKARTDGVDVRGYYHASLLDGWEWGSYAPHFGLYAVDRSHPYDRAQTEGATVLGQIAGGRLLDGATHEKYGGDGPMTPEP